MKGLELEFAIRMSLLNRRSKAALACLAKDGSFCNITTTATMATPPSLTNTTSISTNIPVDIIVNAMTAATTLLPRTCFVPGRGTKAKNGVEFLRECQRY
jgi:hypothetical protein